jgi:hypothetical protein
MPKKKVKKRSTALRKTGTSTPVTKSPEKKILGESLRKVWGVRTPEVAYLLCKQAINLQVWTRPRREDTFLGAEALLAELSPRTAAEALLAVQLIGVHEAATTFLHQATAEGQTVEGADRNVLRATRLMRLFTEQLDAMAKLKGRTSQQKVTVEHVHVHDGGQAIVGAVNGHQAAAAEGI